jgi:hypothetical protein
MSFLSINMNEYVVEFKKQRRVEIRENYWHFSTEWNWWRERRLYFCLFVCLFVCVFVWSSTLKQVEDQSQQRISKSYWFVVAFLCTVQRWMYDVADWWIQEQMVSQNPTFWNQRTKWHLRQMMTTKTRRGILTEHRHLLDQHLKIDNHQLEKLASEHWK